MISLILLGAVVVVSAIIVKTGAVALRLTGLDEETAAFQALSAFTRTGFTTLEAERIVNHPHRRRIIKALMLLGNAGIAVTIVALITSFTGLQEEGGMAVSTERNLIRVSALGAFLVVFYLVAAARPVNRVLNRFIARRLKQVTDLGFVEFQEVLSLGGEYGISYVEISETNPVAGKTLAAAALNRMNVLVLAIERKGANIPTPNATTVIEVGDRLVCYGKTHSMRVLAKGNRTDEQPQGEA